MGARAARWGAAALLIVLIGGCTDEPGAEQRMDDAEACLKAAGLKTDSDITYRRGLGNFFVADVDAEDGSHVAYVYTFDFATNAESFVDGERLDMESDPESYEDDPTFEARGGVALRIPEGAPRVDVVRRCADGADSA